MRRAKDDKKLKWFDINNYKQIREWDREKLSIELTARFYLRRIEEQNCFPYENQWFKTTWENIQRTGAAYPDGTSIYAIDSPMAYVAKLRANQLDAMVQHIEQIVGDGDPVTFTDFYDNLVGPSKFLHLMIDTSGDPDIISHELERLILQHKIKNRITTKDRYYKDHHFDKIKDLGIVPVSDIHFWGKLHNIEFPPRIIIDQISPAIRITAKQLGDTPFKNLMEDLFTKKMFISELRASHEQ